MAMHAASSSVFHATTSNEQPFPCKDTRKQEDWRSSKDMRAAEDKVANEHWQALNSHIDDDQSFAHTATVPCTINDIGEPQPPQMSWQAAHGCSLPPLAAAPRCRSAAGGMDEPLPHARQPTLCADSSSSPPSLMRTSSPRLARPALTTKVGDVHAGGAHGQRQETNMANSGLSTRPSP
ncbi:hypothetical protein Dimus_016726 [Dionaea muscipula]